MSRRLFFFATKNDLISIMNTFCELLPFEVKYFETGNMPTEQPEIFSCIEELPHIGITYSKSHCSDNYSIMKKDIPVVTERVDSDTLGTFYCAYDSMNSTCLSFSPSGLTADGACLIHGQFAVMDKNEISDTLMKTAAKALRKHCKRIKGWYFGQEAEQLNGKVRYITIGISEPQEYDFKLS